MHTARLPFEKNEKQDRTIIKAQSSRIGRLADRGLTRLATGIALGVVIVSLLLPLMIQSSSPVGIAVLVAAAILLDMGVSANLVLSQRAIFSLAPEFKFRCQRKNGTLTEYEIGRYPHIQQDSSGHQNCYSDGGAALNHERE